MLLEIYDGVTLNRVGIIKTFTFVQYTDFFNDIGTFSVKVPITETSLDFLRIRGNFILFEKLGDKFIMGIIDYVHKEGIASATVEIKGYLLNKLLSYRVIMRTFTMSGKIFDIQRILVDENFISPEDAKRKINGVKLNPTYPLNSEKISFCITGEEISYAISKMNDNNRYGYALVPEIQKYNPQSGTQQNISGFVFKQYIPSDRSVGNQEGNDPVIFDTELFNVENIMYEIDCTKLKSIAIVAGEDSGEDRKILEVGDLTLSDRNRIELYVDARDIQSEQETVEVETDENSGELEQTTNATMTEEEYDEMLHERGLEKLQENSATDKFEATVYTKTNNSFVYGENYFNGDIVTVYDRQINAKANVQIVSVTKSLTEKGEILDLQFSNQNYTVEQF